MAVDVLLRLALLTGEGEYAQRAVRILRQLVRPMTQHPMAFGELLNALDFHLSGPARGGARRRDSAPDTRELVAVLNSAWLPNKVMALRAPDDHAASAAIPLLADRPALDDRATAYVCQNYACELPTDPLVLAEQLGLAR